MYAAQIYRRTQWSSTEIRNLIPESMAVFDEIFAMLEQIETEQLNQYRAVWLCADRGTVQDMGFADETETLEYFGVSDQAQLQEAFLREFPDEVYWFKLETMQDGSWRHLRLQNFSVTIVEEAPEGSPYGCTDLLAWIREELSRVLDALRAGTYNRRIAAELPLAQRYGTISRSAYWRLCPQERESALKNLSRTEIEQFIDIAASEEKEAAPIGRLQDLTFNQYFRFASYAFRSVGLAAENRTLLEQFLRYGEDFGGDILRELNPDSHADFLRYFSGELRMGGHPWGLRRGSSRTRIMLVPRKDAGGWYFTFSGDPNWNIYEMVKMYLALKDHACPVCLAGGAACIRYLREEDRIGIVPAGRACVYCESAFPRMDVHDFRHLDVSCAELKNEIAWMPLETVKLRGE